ncbi:MAG: phage holin family protein [Solirubrobacterales bacterium]|nr:phage holin family protein [Solirubrobacterales bacterium]
MTPDRQTSELARAIQEITEKAQLLVHEEIELAKAEMTEKVSKLVKGAILGIIAGVFAILALIYLLHALSWGLWDLIGSDSNFWLGFLITGVLILILGAVAGLIAMRMIKKGSPPKPVLAIEEAQLIKATLTASPASQTVGPVGARQAPAKVER